MLSPIAKVALFIYTLLLPGIILAAAPVYGMGKVADNLLDPVSVFSSFISTISLMIGCCFLFASFIKYTQHRVNPLAVPISTVVFLVIMGIILVSLPLAYKLSNVHFYNLSQ